MSRKPSRLGRPPASSYPLVVEVAGKTWIQAREAARRLSVTLARVSQLLGDGRLTGRLIHQTRYVLEDDVTRYHALQTELTRLRAAMSPSPRRRRTE